ncbi:MAG: hypothetical protein ABI402_09885 [Ferruginibacter sp.]
MEELIELYLFQHKHCPLPLIGSLQLKDGHAVAWHGDNKLSAPVPQIELTKTEISSEHFIAFIAAYDKISIGEASLTLQKYCLELQKLTAYKEMKLEHAGRFYIDQYGALVFKQDALPKEFLPSVPIQRVVRSKSASHNIRVGDNETTTEYMTEYYSEKEKTKTGMWWIIALILTVIIAAALYFYFKDHSYTENFGNVQPVITSPVESTYQTK